MRVGFISQSERFYTTERLMNVAGNMGHEAILIPPGGTSISAGQQGNQVLIHGREAPSIDKIIPRVGSKLTQWSIQLLDALMASGAQSLMTPNAIALSADKLRTALVLAAHHIPTVPTFAIREETDIHQAMTAFGNGPWVLKLAGGTQGQNVMLAREVEEGTEIARNWIRSHHLVLVQPLISMPHPRDLRILVLDGACIAQYWRYAAEGEFRSNIHLGGRVVVDNSQTEAAALARKAASAVGARFCGVDLLPLHDASQFEDNWAVLEVNGSPGIEGIEKESGRDLATVIIEAALAH
jgi:ribosomal protein S6--L-glutamate ligase